jgi:hypothetical protein
VVAEAAVEAAKAAKREPLMVELAALELRTKQLHSELGSTVKPPAWLGERRTMQRERWRCVAAWMDAPARLFSLSEIDPFRRRISPPALGRWTRAGVGAIVKWRAYQRYEQTNLL